MLKWAAGVVVRSLSRDAWPVNIGLARSLIAISGLGTLLASSTSTLIRPAAGVDPLFCEGPAAISAWCMAPVGTLEPIRWMCVLVLALAATGWRPRLTALPLWWVLFGNQASLTVVDGGDQIAAVLALLLIPIALTDDRKWHWTLTAPGRPRAHPYAAVVAHITLVVAQVQVAYIYINACLAKLAVPEWLDGSAVYYWLRDPMFGPAGGLRQFADALMAQPIPVAMVTWGTLFLEFALGISILLPRKGRRILLVFGLVFHLGIAVAMGLWSFAFAMWGGLLLMLWPEGNFIVLTSHLAEMRRDRRQLIGKLEGRS